MGRSIRLVVVGLVLALAVAACGGKDEAEPQAAAPNASTIFGHVRVAVQRSGRLARRRPRVRSS